MSRFKRLVFQPETSRDILRGANQIVNAVRPTIGPQPRVVAYESMSEQLRPQLLDEGAVIARRVIQLPDRDEDVGAMLIREMMWQIRDEVGDGTATAAVIFQSIFSQGLRYAAAGGNTQRLRHYLNEAIAGIVSELDAMTFTVEGKQALTHIAQSICYDPPLAKMLGEIFDIIGEYGHLNVRTGRRRGLQREYVEGNHWASGVLSRSMLSSGSIAMENVGLVLTDMEFDDPMDITPAMRAALQAKIRALVIVARKISDKVVGFLMTNKNPEKFNLVVVKTPGLTTEDQAAALTDMSVLTGGNVFFYQSGETLENIRPTDLGRARGVWADATHFGMRAGKGDARLLRQHLRSLQAGFAIADDPDQRRKLRERIGKLMGGSATLWIGAATESELKLRQALAERTAEAVRGAVRDGVLPGGGAALLACSIKLRKQAKSCTDDEQRMAYKMIADALEQPMRAILANAGHEPSQVMAEVLRKRGCRAMDINTGRVVDVTQAGILDVAAVQKEVVKRAVGAAALALTVDVMVHKKVQREDASLTPGKSNDFFSK